MDMGEERFLAAQEATYTRALKEIRSGKKQTHWMWYIFPQIRGLGHSITAQQYALQGLDEARAYLKHPVLGSRLREISAVLLSLDENDPVRIFGAVDAMKLRSCMTLFDLVAEKNGVFNKVLEKYYGGIGDDATYAITAAENNRKGV